MWNVLSGSLNLQTGPIHKEQGEVKERGILVGGSCNKQGNLHTKLVLGSCKMSRSLHPPARILKVYTEDLAGLSHKHSPDGLNNTLFSQGCNLERAARVGVLDKTYIPRTGEEMRSFNCLGKVHR